MLGSWYAYAAALCPDQVPYNLSFWRAGASVAGTALTSWLAYRRSRTVLPAAAAMALGTMALGTFNKYKTGAYVTRTWPINSMRESVFNRAMPIAHAIESVALVGLAAYAMAKGRKSAARSSCISAANAAQTAKSVMCSSLGPKSDPGPPLFKASWYPQARKLGLYFMSFSMLGHWVEMLFCMGIKHGIFKGGYDRENHMLWDQWLFPFPAEGTAAVLAEVVLRPITAALQMGIASRVAASPFPTALATPLAMGVSFLVNQIVCTSIDFATGMVANRNYELWDYRDMRFHFMGQVCLQNSLFYSTIATWGVWWLLPKLDELLAQVSDISLDGVLVGFGSFFAFLELLYQVIPFGKGSPGQVGE